MRCIVTGGAGFLGSHLAESLIVHGNEVVVIDDLFRGRWKNLEMLKGSPGYYKMKGDACSIEVLKEAAEKLGGVDVIYHLAAINGTKWFHEKANMVVDVNIRSTITAIQLANDEACRLVFTSSPEAFGDNQEMPLANGMSSVFSSPHLHQRHSYGASKYLGEILVQHAHRTKDLDTRIIRPFNVYGPRSPGNDYGQVVNIFLENIIAERQITVHDEGKQTRSFTWIDDAIEGIMLAGTLDRGVDGSLLSGGAWNIGMPKETSILELAKLIYEICEKEEKIIFGKGHPGDSNRRIPDISNTETQLGWYPMTELQQGLEKTLRSFQMV